MLPEEIELFLRSEIAANCTLDWLMEQLFDDENPEEARAALKRIANVYAEESPQSLEALVYYRGMRSALNEEDFRWGAFQELKAAERKLLRRERLIQYHRYLELFALEIRLARAVRRSGMALGANWSALEQDLADGARLLKYRGQLHLAATLYRLDIPGALDLCDSAVFEMFRMVYLRPSPTA